MKLTKTLLNMVIATLTLSVIAICQAEAPAQDALGKAQAYPVGTARNWFMQESVRVGSFSHQAEIPRLYNGKANRLRAAAASQVYGA